MLDRLDATLATVRSGAVGELRFTGDDLLPLSATEYFSRNCWIGLSIPGEADKKALDRLGTDRIMWGSDYPHDEGTYPLSRENLRAIFAGTDAAQLHRVLSENAARLFDFDLEALKPLARRVGPTVGEISQPLDQLPERPNEALQRAVGARP